MEILENNTYIFDSQKDLEKILAGKSLTQIKSSHFLDWLKLNYDIKIADKYTHRKIMLRLTTQSLKELQLYIRNNLDIITSGRAIKFPKDTSINLSSMVFAEYLKIFLKEYTDFYSNPKVPEYTVKITNRNLCILSALCCPKFYHDVNKKMVDVMFSEKKLLSMLSKVDLITVTEHKSMLLAYLDNNFLANFHKVFKLESGRVVTPEDSKLYYEIFFHIRDTLEFFDITRNFDLFLNPNGAYMHKINLKLNRYKGIKLKDIYYYITFPRKSLLALTHEHDKFNLDPKNSDLMTLKTLYCRGKLSVNGVSDILLATIKNFIIGNLLLEEDKNDQRSVESNCRI